MTKTHAAEGLTLVEALLREVLFDGLGEDGIAALANALNSALKRLLEDEDNGVVLEACDLIERVMFGNPVQPIEIIHKFNPNLEAACTGTPKLH